jgi:Tol biopolymer transport system component
MTPAGPARSLHFDKSRCHGLAWDVGGRDLIVSSDRRGSVELWRVPVGGSAEPSRIQVSDDLPLDIAVSQTGQRMAYTHYSQDWNIWRVDLTSAQLKTVVSLIASPRNEFHPRYSADGKRIAFESNRFGHNPEIWVSDADGSHAVQITSFGNAWAGSPSWSPDGQQIAFDGDAAGQWDIYLMPSQGGKAFRLTSGSRSKFRPSRSHDGKWIYYCVAGEGDPQIWKKPATGGAEIQITKNGGCNQMESPDGRYVYYLGKANSAVWRVPVDGGEETQLIELGPQSNSTGVGGSHFTLGKHGVYFFDSIETETLRFMNYETRSTKVLGTLPGPIVHGFTVSPDERWLLYAKSDSAGSQLRLVENFR